MVVRVVMYGNYLKTAGKFTLGQLRLICIPKDSGQDALTGKAVNAYSIGYFSGEDEITTIRLSELITIDRRVDFPEGKNKRNIDFAFNVPNDYAPAALQFKQNVVLKVSRAVSSDQAPPIEPFVKKSKAKTESSSPSGSDEDETSPRSGDNRGASSNDEKSRGLTPLGRLTTGGVTDEDLNPNQ